MNDAGIWYATGGVQTNKTKESLVEFDRELKEIAGSKPITEAEFTDNRDRLVRGYAQQFESLGRIDDQIADLWTEGLPMTELQRDYDETGKVTREAAQAAALKFASPEKARWLLVGDRARIEAGARVIGLGEIVLLDAEGRPAKK